VTVLEPHQHLARTLRIETDIVLRFKPGAAVPAPNSTFEGEAQDSYSIHRFKGKGLISGMNCSNGRSDTLVYVRVYWNITEIINVSTGEVEQRIDEEGPRS
jgi:hypothetical protein